MRNQGYSYEYTASQIQGCADGVNTAPVANQMDMQDIHPGEPRSFTVPDNAFFDIDILAGQHLVGDGGERPFVAARVQAHAAHLLERHVADSSAACRAEPARIRLHGGEKLAREPCRSPDAEHGIDGVTIENLRLNGQPVRDAAAARLSIGAHVRNVRF